jgi:hypothetical protein
MLPLRYTWAQALSPRSSSRRRGERGLINDAAYNVDRATQQRHRGLERAKADMGRQRDVVQNGKRVIGSQRFGLEHVEPGVADAAAAQGIDERGLVDQGAARGI